MVYKCSLLQETMRNETFILWCSATFLLSPRLNHARIPDIYFICSMCGIPEYLTTAVRCREAKANSIVLPRIISFGRRSLKRLNYRVSGRKLILNQMIFTACEDHLTGTRSRLQSYRSMAFEILTKAVCSTELYRYFEGLVNARWLNLSKNQRVGAHRNGAHFQVVPHLKCYKKRKHSIALEGAKTNPNGSWTPTLGCVKLPMLTRVLDRWIVKRHSALRYYPTHVKNHIFFFLTKQRTQYHRRKHLFRSQDTRNWIQKHSPRSYKKRFFCAKYTTMHRLRDTDKSLKTSLKNKLISVFFREAAEDCESDRTGSRRHFSGSGGTSQ